jgi:hypothetical protein
MFNIPERAYPDPDYDIEYSNALWSKREHDEEIAYDYWKAKQGEPS